MRRLIVQLLTQLESACAIHERDESTQMIMMLVLSANHSVHPYVSDILRTILPRIDDGPPQLVSKLFDTIAALAQVNSNALMPYSNRILASIMQTLGGSTSWQKCMSALKALSSCASYCSMVIDPYTQYPQLFAILLRLLKTESDDIKEETMRVIGALGAVDPHTHKDMLHHGFARGGSTVYNISGHSQTLAFSGTSKDNKAVNGMNSNNINNEFISGANTARQGSLLSKKRCGKRHGGPPPNVMTVFNSEMPRESLVGDIQVGSYGTTFTNDPSYFTSVSVNALLQILNSTEDAKSHLLAVQALNTMFAPLQNICGQYLDSVVPAILRAMKAAPPETAESYIERLGRLVGIARQLIRPYLEPLFELFDFEAVISEQHQNVLISLIEVMVEALSGNLGHNTNKIVSFLISVLDHDLSKTRRQALNAIHALQILSPSLDNYIFLIIPRLVALLNPETLPMTVVIKSLEAIQSIVSSVGCKSFASRIINVLVRLLQTTSDLELQTSIIDTLCILMEQLQDEFTLFMPTINAIMKKCRLADNHKYERYSRLLFTGKLEPMQKQHVQPLFQGESSQKDSLLGAIASEIPQLNVDINQLRNSWIIQQQQQQQGSSISMMRWLDNFTIELISQSPSPAIRACKELAQSNQSLRSKLFNAAFVSCWTVLSVEYQKEVFDSLQEVAAQAYVPADILQTILSLAGFMERDGKVIPINLKLLGQYADRCHALAKELHYKEEEWTMEGDYDTITQLIQLNQSLDLHDSAIGMLNYVRKEQPDIEESAEWYTRLERWDDALKIYRQEEAEFGYSSTNLIGQIQCLYKVCDWESLVPIYDRIWQSSDSNLQSAAAMIGTNMAWAMNDIDRMVTYLPMLPSDSRDKSLSRALLAVYQNQFDNARAYIRSARAEMHNNLVSYLTESYGRGYMQVFRCQMLTELEEVISYKLAVNNRERQVAITNTWHKRLDGIRQDVGMWQKLLRLRSMVLRPILDLDTWIKYVNMCRTSNRMKIARRAIHLLLEDEANFMDEVNTLVYMYLKFKWAANEHREAFQMLEMFTNNYSARIGFDSRNPEAFDYQIYSYPLTNGNKYSDEDKAERTHMHRLLARFYFRRGEWLRNVQQSVTLAEESHAKARISSSVSYRAATILDEMSYKAWHQLAVWHYSETQKYGTEHADVSEDIVESHVVPAVHGFFRAIQLSMGFTTLQDMLRLLTVWFNYAQHKRVVETVQTELNSISLQMWIQVIPQILARAHIQHESTVELIKRILVEVGKLHPNAVLFPLYVAARGDNEDRVRVSKTVLASLHEFSPELVEETEVVSRELIRITLLSHEIWHDALEYTAKMYFELNNDEDIQGILMPLHEKLKITIFDSKQHPREMHIHGSDGNKYTFILKGHEDLRQDERVMQLFGLVNSLLAVDEETSRRSLAIERYPVTPLSSNSGLIGFYPNCENITDVIRSYRGAHQRYVQEENEMLFNISSDWQTLSSIERIESYEYVMERTRGDDLQQAMWYNSPNAETWLERRTNYTRSMAVMSVVGYILGLGDRHLTNILLHSSNGKVVHIDLGDCFEIAIQREGFPETVPFRLTRMVMLPMEVSSSIEGTFRFTANHTMRVLRANRDSLMAVLEAFVFDPLVSWSFTQETETITPTQSAAGGRDTSSVVESQVFSWKAMSRPNNFGKNEWVLPGSRPENAYSRSFRVRGESINEKGWQNGNPKAKSIFKRIHSKLVGTDFDPNVPLSAVDQVEKLIQQATSPDNLAVMYAGWMPIW
ncbi:phosphatidylinositol kinase- protein kinase tor1 [Coemansia sp. RSA 486]|nr:phosphatidylinositol kinase- protein kinase tor1 [Coemansia sp. RSA 486]